MNFATFRCTRLMLFASLLAPFSLAQTVLVSNLAELSGIDYDVGTSSGTGWLSTGFTTGTTGMSLTSATVAFTWVGGSPSAVAYLFSNNGGVPTSTGSGGLLATSNSVTVTEGTAANVVFTFSSTPTLSANTTYHLTLAGTSTFAMLNTTDSLTETGLSGWSIADNLSKSSDSGVTWAGYNTDAIRFSLSGTAIPEPGTYAVIAAAAVLGLALLRRRVS